jgi:cytochrome c oxidase cbb3-type subunit 3
MTTPRNDDPAGARPGALQDKLLDHTYDDIQEYDNPMPRWWLLTFAGTVVFSVLYVFDVGPIGNGKGRIADYEAEVKAHAAAHPAPSGDTPPAQLAALVKDPEALRLGKETYLAFCASCHRADGGGLIGPNLADTYWIHGGAVTDIYRTVSNGVLEKGMPPWAKTLKPAQLEAVVAYVASLQGSNPADGKAPQGVQAAP